MILTGLKDEGFTQELENNFKSEFLESVKAPSNARPAPQYDFRKDWCRFWEYFAVFHNAEFKKEDVVLEFGAYASFICIHLAKYVKKMVVSDNFDWFYRRGPLGCYLKDEWIEELKKYNLDNLEVLESDIQDTKFEDKTFDKIVSHGSFEHVKDYAKGLKEMSRILKDDGRISMTIDFKFGDEIPNDYNKFGGVFSRESWEKLVFESPLECVGDLFKVIDEVKEEKRGTINSDLIFALAVVLEKKKIING